LREQVGHCEHERGAAAVHAWCVVLCLGLPRERGASGGPSSAPAGSPASRLVGGVQAPPVLTPAACAAPTSAQGRLGAVRGRPLVA